MFPETPFDIAQYQTGFQRGTNGQVTMTTEVPCVMRRRRSRQPGQISPSETLYAQLPDGTMVYVRRLVTGHVDITVTKRQIY